MKYKYKFMLYNVLTIRFIWSILKYVFKNWTKQNCILIYLIWMKWPNFLKNSVVKCGRLYSIFWWVTLMGVFIWRSRSVFQWVILTESLRILSQNYWFALWYDGLFLSRSRGAPLHFGFWVSHGAAVTSSLGKFRSEYDSKSSGPANLLRSSWLCIVVSDPFGKALERELNYCKLFRRQKLYMAWSLVNSGIYAHCRHWNSWDRETCRENLCFLCNHEL